jgi:hypothetical protein
MVSNLSAGDAQTFVDRIDEASSRTTSRSRASQLTLVRTSLFFQTGVGWPRARDTEEVSALAIQDLRQPFVCSKIVGNSTLLRPKKEPDSSC